MGIRKHFTVTKTTEQIRKEARAAAVADLREIITIITEAGQLDLLATNSGSASLVGVAHALFKEHCSKIEADATEYDTPAGRPQ
jgi:hypothetical protein